VGFGAGVEVGVAVGFGIVVGVAVGFGVGVGSTPFAQPRTRRTRNATPVRLEQTLRVLAICSLLGSSYGGWSPIRHLSMRDSYRADPIGGTVVIPNYLKFVKNRLRNFSQSHQSGNVPDTHSAYGVSQAHHIIVDGVTTVIRSPTTGTWGTHAWSCRFGYTTGTTKRRIHPAPKKDVPNRFLGWTHPC
jgi:hypothetical protein